MSDNDDRILAEGIAIAAVTAFSMGYDEQQAEAAVLQQWEASGRPDLQTAADAVQRLGAPPVESADRTERLAPAREALGAMTPTDHLEAALAARELLERLARDRR